MTQWTPGKPKPWEGARQWAARAMGAAVTSLTLLLAELLVGEVSSLVSVLVALCIPSLSDNLNTDEGGTRVLTMLTPALSPAASMPLSSQSWRSPPC